MSDLLNRNSVWALKADLEAKVATRLEDMVTFDPLLELGVERNFCEPSCRQETNELNRLKGIDKKSESIR